MPIARPTIADIIVILLPPRSNRENYPAPLSLLQDDFRSARAKRAVNSQSACVKPQFSAVNLQLRQTTRDDGRLSACERPEDLRPPVLGIGIIARIGDIRFPRRSGCGKTFGFYPLSDCGVRLVELIIRTGMRGGSRQSAGQGFAANISAGRRRDVGGHRESGFDGPQFGSLFEISREWRTCQRKTLLLRVPCRYCPIFDAGPAAARLISSMLRSNPRRAFTRL